MIGDLNHGGDFFSDIILLSKGFNDEIIFQLL